MPIQHLQTDTREHEGQARTVAVHDLHFTYPDGTVALRGVSLTVAAGEKVALVGPNGAGKSTLMLHLNGLLGEHDDGQAPIIVAGFPVTRPNLPRIRAQVGMVFQNPDDQLFSPTVFDDVAFGPLHMGFPEAEVRARVARSLEQVGMSEAAARLSHHLSLGQKKRVSIATVLSMDPEILVLDEPSAGLDPRARRALITLLQELPQTMLVSSHDLRLVRELLPRTIVMDEGEVVADGPTSKILADVALLAAHGLEG
jgi:cobalt/nickel transport system ATP-binding protein